MAAQNSRRPADCRPSDVSRIVPLQIAAVVGDGAMLHGDQVDLRQDVAFEFELEAVHLVDVEAAFAVPW